MNKNTAIVVVLCLVGLIIGLGSCSDSPTETQPVNITKSAATPAPAQATPQPTENLSAKVMDLSADDFQALVKFINKNGFTIPDTMGRGDNREYIFHDSQNNRHGMIPTHSDNGSLDQIPVWAYERGVKDQDHFFGYTISKNKVITDVPEDSLKPGEKDRIKLAITELLAKAKKSA